MKRRHGTTGELRNFHHRQVLIEPQRNQDSILCSDLRKRGLQRLLEPVDVLPPLRIVDRRFRTVVTAQLLCGFFTHFRIPHAHRQLFPNLPQLWVGQPDIVIDPEDFEGFFDAMRVAVDEALEQHRDRPEPLGHRRGTPASPLFRAEIERQALDDRGQVGPEGAAILELAEDRVILIDQP